MENNSLDTNPAILWAKPPNIFHGPARPMGEVPRPFNLTFLLGSSIMF